MNRGVSAGVIGVVGAVLIGWTLSSFAAVQGPIDPKFQIPVPKTQRKIAPGEEKGFEGTDLKVKVVSAERGSVTITVNGAAERKLEQSKLTLVAIDPNTVCTVVYLGLSGQKATIGGRCDPSTPELLATAKAQEEEASKPVVSAQEMADNTPKGEIKDPYDGDPQAIAEGHELFLANSCNGCHGGNGGGGMCPPLSNNVWVYGNDYDTLFRLVTYGSLGLQDHGYNRIAQEVVVGPMPAFGEIIDNADNLLKILAFVRSLTASPTN